MGGRAGIDRAARDGTDQGEVEEGGKGKGKDKRRERRRRGRLCPPSSSV